MDPLEIGLSLLFIVLGLIIITILVKTVIMLIPAAIVAAIVYFLTGSYLYTAGAFLIIAAISLLKKL